MGILEAVIKDNLFNTAYKWLISEEKLECRIRATEEISSLEKEFRVRQREAKKVINQEERAYLDRKLQRIEDDHRKE